MKHFEWTRKKIIILAGVLTVIVVIVALLSIRGNTVITVIPGFASVTIDEKGPALNGSFDLTEGKHTVLMKADGFADRKVIISIQKNEKFEKTYCLTANSEKGYAWQKKNQQLGLRCEGISGQEYKENVDKVIEANPFVGILPYKTVHYQIGIGASVKNPDDPAAFAVIINYDTENDMMKAENWLLTQNVDIRSQEIIYKQRDPELLIEDE